MVTCERATALLRLTAATFPNAPFGKVEPAMMADLFFSTENGTKRAATV